MASGTDVPNSMEVDGEAAAVKDDINASGEPLGDLANGIDKTKLNGTLVETLVEHEARVKRQIKKDDSGISVEKSENSSDEGSKKPKTTEELDQQLETECPPSSSTKDSKMFVKRLKIKSRNYRSKKSELRVDSSDEDEDEGASKEEDVAKMEGRSSPDSGHQESASGMLDVDMEESQDGEDGTEETAEDRTRKRTCASESEDTNDSADTEDKKSDAVSSEEEEMPPPAVLSKPKPKHKWFLMQEVLNRQKGVSNRYQGQVLFQQRFYASLHAVQRLELMYKLEQHYGCVNALHFNSSGTMLASGSDDLSIVIWNWARGKHLVTYDSGHRSNVFQVKFLPLTGDTHVVSSGRDGQIRLGELSSTGVCRVTRRLAQHRGPAHKLAILPETPHVFLSSGEDGVVLSVDVRAPKPQKLLTVIEADKHIALYSIHSNPLNSNEFCVSGRFNHVLLYDRRKSSHRQELKRFCPRHLALPTTCAHVTCAVFNYNGTEILGSYNDEDIYLFDTKGDSYEYVHKYEGHRNSATVKGVSFFGPRSEYIVSGSDCSHIFFWEKSSEAIVQWMPGDENGVVNCLEPHPQIPVIATSGLDDDVKIWIPSCENEPNLESLKTTVLANRKSRDEERRRDPDTFDGQMLWILWRHIRRTERRRNQQSSSSPSSRDPPSSHPRRFSTRRNLSNDNPSSSSSSSSNSSDNEDENQRIQCSPS